MAKKDNITQTEADIAETLGKTEQFIEDNKKSLSLIVGAIVLIVGGYIGYTKYIMQPKEESAAEQMYVAERYFEQDSLDLALNGDGNYPGFLAIMDDYSGTKAANLSHYYAGMIYLNKGQFEEAISHLKDYDGDDLMTGTLATGAIGDAYMELGNTDEAISYYKKAASNNANAFTTPMFLMKQGQATEIKGDYKKAGELYQRVKTDYPESAEARDIERYIGKAEAMVQ